MTEYNTFELHLWQGIRLLAPREASGFLYPGIPTSKRSRRWWGCETNRLSMELIVPKKSENINNIKRNIM